MSTLRVAMVTPRFAPLVGGVETHTREVARRLVGRDVSVEVHTIDRGADHTTEALVDGVVVYRHPGRVPGGFSRSLRRALAARASSYDVLHVQGVHTALPSLALPAARRAGRPAVLTFHTGGHSSRLRAALRGAQWQALRPALAGCHRLVAVCEYEVDYFSDRLKLPRERFRVIRNGADPLPLDAGVTTPASGSPLVLSVARLERYKGHHRLLTAWPEVVRRAPQARLVIVGSGPYESALRRQVADLGLQAAVSFLSFGPDERDRLGALMAAADATALLSDYEAHPVAVLEAVALGVPTLVARGSGLTELAAAGLVDSVDRSAAPDELARAVLATAARGRQTPSPELPSWDDASAQLLQLYREVVS